MKGFQHSMKSHILITGGTGFVGGYISDGLAKAGYRVTAVSRNGVNEKNQICVDLTNEEAVIRLAKELPSIDTIIHCAAIAHGEKPPKNDSVANFNSSISNNIRKAFGGRGIHLIFMSSVSVYGELYSELPIPIKINPIPFDSYGLGKLYDEKLFISNFSHLDILRLVPVYDNENLKDIKKRVFLPKINIKIMIRPTPFHSLCNLNDVLNAVKKCMQYSSGQRIFHVGESQPVSQNDLVGWFSGRYIVVPQLIFKVILFLLPKKFSLLKSVSLMFKKFGLNNIYEMGHLELD